MDFNLAVASSKAQMIPFYTELDMKLRFTPG